MIIETSRFGQIELNSEDLIDFPEGILGFSGLRHFVLLDDPNDEIFAWLQSCENAGIAFPVLEPELIFTPYKVNLTKGDSAGIALKAGQKARSFAIVTIPEDITMMTANMKAPIVINIEERIARQCVLQDNSLSIRDPIFLKLQQRLVQGLSTRATEGDVRMVVPLIQKPIRTPEAAT
jgi:flagellar assembly factor FliW